MDKNIDKKIIDIPVCELSEMLQNKEISALEVTQAYIDRINATEGKVNSFITIFESKAFQMAEEADRRLRTGEDVTPLTGVPVALKDNLCFEGYPTTCASKMLKNFIPPYNATVVQKLIDAGSVFLGKTNMDEFAMGSSTENSRFFTTKNPWDLERVPGGSSGGSAASVASMQAPLALGSDTGGSIRQPAALCGITGLKPTYGAVSRYGLVAFASSLDQIGPMGRSVKDIALLYDQIAGHDPLDATSVPDVSSNISSKLNDVSVSGRKIGVIKEFMQDLQDEGVRKVFENARAVFEDQGAEFIEVSMPSIRYALPVYYIIAPSEASSNLARYDGARYGFREDSGGTVAEMFSATRREAFGDEVLRRIMIGTYALSSGYYDAYYLKAQKVRTLICQEYERALSEADFLLSPATPTTAFKIGEKSEDPLQMYLSDIYTVSVNIAGLPGLTIPGGFSEGLPVGVQLIGKAYEEKPLLQAGAVFQNITDFHKTFPDI